MKKAVDYYTSVFDLERFTVYEFAPDKHWYMEEPSPIKLQLGNAMLGTIELELIQPLEGKRITRKSSRCLAKICSIWV